MKIIATIGVGENGRDAKKHEIEGGPQGAVEIRFENGMGILAVALPPDENQDEYMVSVTPTFPDLQDESNGLLAKSPTMIVMGSEGKGGQVKTVHSTSNGDPIAIEFANPKDKKNEDGEPIFELNN